MKIAATAVSMDAAQTFRDIEHHSIDFETSPATSTPANLAADFGVHLAHSLSSTTLSQTTAQSVVRHTGPVTSLPGSATAAVSAEATAQLLSEITTQLAGQEATIATWEQGPPEPPLTNESSLPASPVRASQAQLVSNSVYVHEDSLFFEAKGAVQTTDGREIAFDFGLSIIQNTTAIDKTALGVSVSFIDPLMLQFDGQAPLLTSSSFLFDLDGNGSEDALACPGKGCGFLAFDRNGDGTINNGLELFGPETGAGFGELAQLDTDQNFWIDENDPIFDRLLLWNPNEPEGTSLISLRQAGVGALSVMHAGTGFQLHNPDGTAQGVVKAAGIFLTEKGEVRSLQEVDLAIQDEQANPAATTGSTDAPKPAATGEALFALRSIIAMQRLRLRLMLTGQRLENRAEFFAVQFNQTNIKSQWLQTHNEWLHTASSPLAQPGRHGRSGADQLLFS